MALAEIEVPVEEDQADSAGEVTKDVREVSSAQRAAILRHFDRQGALTLVELEGEVRPELKSSVASVLEFARRRGFIAPIAPFEVDGRPALEIAWSLTSEGRNWVIDQRSSVPRFVRRIAAETGAGLIRTWIPALILATLVGVTTGKLSRTMFAIIAVEVAVLLGVSWLVNRSVHKSVFGDNRRDCFLKVPGSPSLWRPSEDRTVIAT